MGTARYTIVGFCVVFMICLGMTVGAFAQSVEIKVGFVDLQRVIDSSEEGKRAQAEMKKKADELAQQARQMQQEMQKIKTDYETQALALTPEARTQKRDELVKLERDYNRFVQDSQTELRALEQRALKQLLEEIGKLVVEYGKTNNYTLIFEAGNILYGSDNIELTQEIINLHNQRNQ